MELLEQHFETAFAAPDGIRKLRDLILALAMQGKLIPHDPNDPPAKRVLLKDLALKIGSGSTPAGGKESYVPTGIPLIRSMNVHFGGFKTEGLVFLDDNQAEKLNNVIVHDADVLLNITGASIGRVTVAPPEMENARVNQHVCIIRPNRNVISHYLEAYLASPLIQQHISVIQVGATREALTKAMIEQFCIDLPSIGMQSRIVAKIDDLMTRCDELEKLRAEREAKRLAVHTAAVRQLLNVADTDGHIQAREFLGRHFGELYTVKENVTELRKAILQLAVMGKLVPLDPNDPPASELLEQIKAEKKQLIKEGKIKVPKVLPNIPPDEVPFSLPKGWEWIRIADVAQQITSGSRDWAKYYSTSGAIFVTMGNLSRGSYQLRMDTIRYVSPPNDSEGARTKLEEGDLLISITADVGNLGLIPAGFGDAYINQHTCLLRLMPICRNRYFAELLRSPLAKEQFGAPQRGIKNSFRLGDVEEMLVPLPPIAIQHRIVTEIDRLMSMCDTLERQIDAARETQSSLLNAMMVRYGGQRCA
jgi:type I restriction enzyme S subunit